MKLLQQCLLLILAALLPLGAAQAQVRAAAVLDMTNARLLHADGSPYHLPGIWYDQYSSHGSALMRWADDIASDGSGEDYGRWTYGRCIGDCPGNFPPQDTSIPPGGYANAWSSGAMWLGRDEWTGSLQRAHVAATGQLPSEAGVHISALVWIQPERTESLVFAFDASPYMDLYRFPGTPAASELQGGISLRISLLNLTTGEEILQFADPALNRALRFADGQSDTSLIYDPGILSFAIDLGTLDPAYAYELRVVHGAHAWAVLAVPEPSSGSLYLAGVLVVGAFALRRRAAPAGVDNAP